MTTVATTEIINNNGKIGEGSSDKKEKVDNETSIDVEKRKALVALMALKNNYARILELQNRENIVDLDSVLSLSVSAGSFIISGGGVIAAFRSLLTSTPSSNSGIEKDENSDIDLAESSILYVQSNLKDDDLRSLEMFECFWLFGGCVILFGIAGYDFLNFATGNSNGIILDIALINIGFIGLVLSLAVGIVLQYAKQRFSDKNNKKKCIFYLVFPFICCFCLISINDKKELELKDIRFQRAEEEKVLSLLYGVKPHDDK
ncbi:24181_t:CDS:2 [Dentiscutata erythropus]|uniref:24181_t:CDS:1 n=1 Tax=Dentiscutata erythropus TaxID=1348616 RepID=A0A9N8VZE9_9GLOM|nr:24181_t:CDS:2 [Dentiscutata erythropus]